MTTRPSEIPPSLAAKLHRISPDEQARVLSTSLLSIGRIKGMVDAVELSSRVDGDTAEVGVANGGTSRLIALLNGGRTHWVCDTFEGLLDVGENDPQFTNHQFHNPAHKVEAALSGLTNFRLVAGYFPESATPEMSGAKYSLVHIDVDTYASIKACFEFFASRMSPGGVIVLDDVLERGTVGAIKAFGELPRKGWREIARTPPQCVVRFD